MSRTSHSWRIVRSSFPVALGDLTCGNPYSAVRRLPASCHLLREEGLRGEGLRRTDARETKSICPRPRCQSSSQIALSCPACRWSLLKWSVPRPGQSLDERLTLEDEIWLAKMNISFGTSRRNARRVPAPRSATGNWARHRGDPAATGNGDRGFRALPSLPLKVDSYAPGFVMPRREIRRRKRPYYTTTLRYNHARSPSPFRIG